MQSIIFEIYKLIIAFAKALHPREKSTNHRQKLLCLIPCGKLPIVEPNIQRFGAPTPRE